MSKKFVKKEELGLVNGGYLVAGKKETPVYNEEFIAAQEHAEWVITFAEKAKGKDFVGKKADSLEAVKAEVMEALYDSTRKYLKEPKEVKSEIHDKLRDEAMAFIKHTQESYKVGEINEFLQQFNIIQEFEEFGLYFEEDVCKLKKIYTMDEIIKAVKEVIDLLD